MHTLMANQNPDTQDVIPQKTVTAKNLNCR